MLPKKQIFRKVALERLSSPEQLDLVMQVTSPRSWIALSAVGLLLVTLVIWGILGSIPEKTQATGGGPVRLSICRDHHFTRCGGSSDPYFRAGSSN